jgi:hypothetical protein
LYMGRSLLAEAQAEAIKRRGEPKKTELNLLVYKERTAEPADLKIMAAFLPDSFHEMLELTSKDSLIAKAGTALQAIDRVQRALARSAQEYLFRTQQAYLARLQAAGKLRTFIHQLRDRIYTKRLHGFHKEHLEQWEKAQRRAVVRERVQRFRNSKKSAG